LGSIEQHCSAPLGTDTIIIRRLAELSCTIFERRNNVRYIILPLLYYGFSPEWKHYPGTITLTIETYKGIVRAILDSLKRAGFNKIALLNGHGGNTTILEAVVREWASENSGVVVGLVDYWRSAKLKLGHCDWIEEKLLSEILGYNVVCGCERKITLQTSSRIISLPRHDESVGFELDRRAAVSIEDIANKIAGELEKIYYHSGELSL
jgi:creatinine amidohydrolase